MSKKILGLDLGTNSIGWAVVNENNEGHLTGIEAAGSRIIPMDAAQLGDYAKGNTVSQTSERTHYRGVRRLYQRQALRRERLLRVLSIMGFLPKHFNNALSRYGKFKEEVRLPWYKDETGQWQFLFQQSYEEMLADFRKHQPEWLADGAKVPYDWTIYYLRKKALTSAILPQELAWILLQFNQKRGYNLLRGQEDEFEEKEADKDIKFASLRIVSVTPKEQDKKKGTWYDILLENGLVYRRALSTQPQWEGQTKEFIITTTLDKDGNSKKDKEGNIMRKISMPAPNDWTLLKKKTEHHIDNSGKEVGEYIYDTLLANPKQKIIGQHVRTIDRKFYEQELRKILTTQAQFIPQLQDHELYAQCIQELYPSNEAYRNSIAKPNFTYLLGKDILLYQRPLRSKKSLINTCNYESHQYTDKESKQQTAGVKCIAKSHPLYQEFRLWQFIQNIRIYLNETIVNGHTVLDHDVTDQWIPDNDTRARIFEILNDEKEIDEKGFFSKCLGQKATKTKPLEYRWNYIQGDKKYPCNETRHAMLVALKKAEVSADFLNGKRQEALWHILYSIDDKQQLLRTLNNYAQRKQLSEMFVEAFAKIPAFKKDYGAYSAKAIKRLLPLMRTGKYWNQEAIDAETLQRINHIIDGEVDESIHERVREKAASLNNITQFQGLPLWLACYVVYNRHSEQGDAQQWTSPDDIDTFLKNFRQHSLRNPIVEQVVTETLRTVRDIWKQTGRIDEIHLEMGRDLKQTAAERAKQTERINSNENRNLRIKAMLTEFMNPGCDIEGVRPYSPSQQDLLQIYEENALEQLTEDDMDYNFISAMSKQSQPSPSEIQRYKQWLDQKYISPYTGQAIPLARLFTPEYEIEHIIPRSRFFDDSFQNKVICEAAVNKLKDNQTGMEFIRHHGGEIVQLGNGKEVEILKEEIYTQHVTQHFAHNRGKMKRLLMDDIPNSFIERQLNDSRYIARYIKGLLSNIVRDNDEADLAISRNLITTNGSITDALKKDWGMNDVWNNIILPRFQRLNTIVSDKGPFTTLNQSGHEIPSMPLDMQKGFNKKRIDHRHHAMDAIVIACTTRSHVMLLNNEAAKSANTQQRHQLSHLLRSYKPTVIDGKERQVPDTFLKPWETFTQDADHAIRNIIVSFKYTQRIINRTQNRSIRFVDGKKQQVLQTKSDQWAIRKPMHKETVYGEVNLRQERKIKLKEALTCIPRILNADLRKKLQELSVEYKSNLKLYVAYFTYHKDIWSDVDLDAIPVLYYTKETKDRYFATRKPLNTDFDEKTIRESITDTGIQKILLAQLARHNNDPKVAFSPEGIEEMNRDIIQLNKGRNHQPIYKVRVYEKANKFAVGQKGNKSKKFVEAAKGTNLFFAVYEDEILNKKTAEFERKRSFYSIPLNDAIEREKQGLPPAPEIGGKVPVFVLSPGDLVYLPTAEQRGKMLTSQEILHERIYKMASCTENRCYFINAEIASIIYDKVEYEKLNKIEKTTDELRQSIKDYCIPIRVDRLGNITEINGKKVNE